MNETNDLNTAKLWIRNNLYIVLVGIISFALAAFLPLLGNGTEISIEAAFPDGPIQWMIWLITKLATSVANIVIFICFNKQGEMNVRNDEHYIYAKNVLLNQKQKVKKPRSPWHFKFDQYGKRGLMIFISSMLSLVSLTNAILQFDWVSFLVYIFVLLFGIITGIIGMKTAEIYWSEEFYEYALMIEQEQNKQEQETTDGTN